MAVLTDYKPVDDINESKVYEDIDNLYEGIMKKYKIA